jgi:hypothetical protein
MTNNSSTRLSDEFKAFLKKLQFNRIKADVDDGILSSVATANLLVKYFKLNNDRYLELVQMEKDNA